MKIKQYSEKGTLCAQPYYEWFVTCAVPTCSSARMVVPVGLATTKERAEEYVQKHCAQLAGWCQASDGKWYCAVHRSF